MKCTICINAVCNLFWQATWSDKDFSYICIIYNCFITGQLHAKMHEGYHVSKNCIRRRKNSIISNIANYCSSFPSLLSFIYFFNLLNYFYMHFIFFYIYIRQKGIKSASQKCYIVFGIEYWEEEKTSWDTHITN